MKTRRLIGFTIVVFLISFTALSSHKLELVPSLVKDKKYSEAVSIYEDYLKMDSTNSSIYYNIGSCYFFQGKYGLASWAFEKSLKYNTKDKDAEYNLEVCYKKMHKTGSWVSSISWIERTLYHLGTNFWAYFSIILSVILALVIYLFFTSRNIGWKKVQLLVAGVILIVNIGSVYIAYSSYQYFTTNEYGVVVKKTIPTYDNNALGKKTDFQLLEGDRVKLTGENGEYRLIEMSNGETYAVKNADIEKI